MTGMSEGAPLDNIVMEGRNLEWLLAAATDAMLIADHQGRIVLVNPALCSLFGYEAAALQGQLVEMLVPAHLRSAHAGMRNGYAQQPRPRAMGAGTELSGVHSDGREFPVEVSLSPLSGNPVLVLAIVRDISQRKQAERENRQLLQELTSANEELTSFAYVVSHDLKAPLRGIGSLADWLATDYAHLFNDEGREHMRLLINRVHRMGALIDGILQYSRVGRVREARSVVDLNILLAGVVDLLAPPPHITLQVQSGLPTLVLEPTRVQQVFHNLISNAIKYMDKPAGLVRVGCESRGGQWRFTVSDNGPGIEARHFERIFQLFQTLAPRDRVESTGVGLALVKKIVEMYHGEVGLDAVMGHGCTFWFTLPDGGQPPVL